MEPYALEEIRSSSSHTAPGPGIKPAEERDDTTRHLRALYREVAKPDAEDNSAYGCVDWYLYPEMQGTHSVS
jgi:hypothetical protein